jgi:hypothetical protein
VDIAAAGSEGSRKLTRVQLSDWQLQEALRPLSRITPAARVEPPPLPGPDAGKDQKPPVEAEVSSPVLNWEVDELIAENGRISLGQPDALIAENLLLRVHHVSKGELSPFTLSGDFASGDVRSQGKLQLQPAFSLISKTTVSHALPFAFNNWMQLSGMPRFVRGRVNANLRVDADDSAAEGAYTGKLIIGLYQGVLETGAFPEDPMLQRTGYRAQDLLERLNASRYIKLSIPVQGVWDGALLTDTLGEAGMAVLKKAGVEARPVAKQTEPQVSKVTRLRLRVGRGFSHNERVRLRQMARALLKDKKLIVELTPQLGTASLDAEMIARVLKNQQKVEQYLNKLGIGSRRIYPVWPQAEHQRGDAPGLLLNARRS